MALTNQERVGKALELLRDGLRPFVERELKAQHAQKWFDEVKAAVGPTQENLFRDEGSAPWDAASLLTVMWNQWQIVFRKTLGQSERTLVSELREVRNRWAHQKPFSSDDTDRALDSMTRLLSSVSAREADEVAKMKTELRRLIFDEQMRSEKRKGASTAIESQVTGNLKPWRDVVSPHKDVASGRYQQAEFAADLWQVHVGEGSDEYKNPAEFFRRTYLTESLKHLLTGAVERMAGTGGDPVVQLQTNFGGGKTHSMLALLHLFSGTAPGDLLGVDAVMSEAKATKLPKVKPVVLVGNKISPGNPSVKPDGTVVRTLWGELAWQLGGKKAFKRIQADDENATSPGDVLREMMNEYGPCLILIDEWVAYARQLHDKADLPGGSFETHFTFAQALTESAKLAKACLLVISLPASNDGASPHTRAEDVEVGGERGHVALERLRNAVGRVEAPWRPASAEEGFEIVRRRLFEPLVEKDQFVARDTVARAFYDQYRTQGQEFPPECRETGYEGRLKAAYPIHPEVFDRLYNDWSTLVKFQRTRGVLRLMAAVIHSLWEKTDRNPLIMPGNISIDDPRVQFELTRYLPENWVPVIEKDVDGPKSLPLELDGVPSLGRFAASRRVARTIYLGSAPTTGAANKGIEDRRIRLGCVMPGESPNVFGDALRRLASQATYLYQDGPRYWYSTQPTVTKLADDRAEQLKRDPDAVSYEIEGRLRADLRRVGEFAGVHPLPASGQDVPDERETRLVVLRPDQTYSKDPNCAALLAAKAIFETRGNTPRLYRNTLVFLAADQARLQDLEDGVRRYLAWKSVVDEVDKLNLDPHQLKQAETQRKSADGVVTARIPETYQWLLVPAQGKPQSPVEFQAIRVSGNEPLAVRATKKLRPDELLLVSLGGTRLRMELDRVPLWRDGKNHVSLRQLDEDFARYLYLPRLVSSDVLRGAIESGLNLVTWARETFAYAEAFDEEAERYVGLQCGKSVRIDLSGPGLLVKADAALAQLSREDAASEARPDVFEGEGGPSGYVHPEGAPAPPAEPPPLRTFYGSVDVDPARVGRDAGRIAEEVIQHLSTLRGAKVIVTLEIKASVPDGIPDGVRRTVAENSRTLKFKSSGFEDE